MSVTGLKVSVLNINNNEYEIKDAESRNDITLINEAIEGLSTRVQTLESGGVSGTIDLHLSSNYAPSTGTNNALELVSGDSYEHAFGKLEKSLSDTEYVMSRTMIDINTRLETLESGSISGSPITPQDLELSDEYATSTGTGSALNLVSGTTYEEAFSKLEKKINDTNTELGNINIPDLELSDEYATSTGTGSALNLVSGTTYEEAFSKLEKKINDNDLKIPTPTISDNNKVLMVVSGSYQLVLPSILYSGTGAPNNANGNNGDIYIQTSGE